MTVKRLLGKEEERLPWWHTEGNRSSSYMMAGLSMQTLAPTVSAEEKKSVLLWTATTEISAEPEERRSSRLNSLDCTVCGSQQRPQQPVLCRHGSECSLVHISFDCIHESWEFSVPPVSGKQISTDTQEKWRYWRGSPGPDPRQRRLIPSANNGKAHQQSAERGGTVNTEPRGSYRSRGAVCFVFCNSVFC